MSATKASPPPQTVEPAADGITILGYAVGWTLILLGLLFWVLALTN